MPCRIVLTSCYLVVACRGESSEYQGFLASHVWQCLLTEVFDGASHGKYTVGLGQTHMGFCTDAEDVCSIALTVFLRLVRKCVGRVARAGSCWLVCDNLKCSLLRCTSNGKRSLAIRNVCVHASGLCSRRFNLSYRDIGRLEVGTESAMDNSKAVKTVLMQLFDGSGNNDVEVWPCTC
jgi:hydroxymethylglutaryl-CoA synthase